MRLKLTFIAAALAVCAAFGADLNFSFVGKYSDKHTKDAETALFDGKYIYNTAHIIWDSGVAPNGCGVILTFQKPTAISKVVVVTAKPNHIAYTPEKTEFQAWDSVKQDWKEAVAIDDVTGRCKDKDFITGEPIKTVWQADATTEGIRILMYGLSIWLTEIEVYDVNGAKLSAEPMPAANADATPLAPCSQGGGASVDINVYSKTEPYVGNPNPLGRRDRSMVLFDIRGALDKGSVTSAVLDLGVTRMGILTTNMFAVEVFENSRSSLRNQDLIASDAKILRQFLYSSNSPTSIRIDITDLVNAKLNQGDGYVGFRMKDITIETVGNRQNKAEGLVLIYQNCKMEIVK
ncbi:MAG: hypothetical protein J5833_05405 [Victivallales bacterium]|nr:hypothetical protein [Victivallales bacterium]